MVLVGGRPVEPGSCSLIACEIPSYFLYCCILHFLFETRSHVAETNLNS